MADILVAIWIHAGEITHKIVQTEDGLYVRSNKNGSEKPFLMEIIYESETDTYFLTCEWLTSSGSKSKSQNPQIHLFPIKDGIMLGDNIKIHKSQHIPSAYDWNSPSKVRNIEFKLTPDLLNTEYLRKKRENSN